MSASKHSRNAQPLRGIIVPLVTPLLSRDNLDVAGLQRLIEHVIDGGVHALFILGTTGEAPSLSYRLRYELIEQTCKIVQGRIPVLAGITDTALTESVNLARHAAEAGAWGVVTTGPYYFPVGQAELAGYIKKLVAELPLPLLLYNMPAFTKFRLEPELVRRTLELDGVIGLKDSSGDLDYFDKILAVTRQRPDWSLLIGSDHLLMDAIHLGAHGGVTGGANLYPRLYVELYQAAASSDWKKASELTKQMCQVAEIYKIGKNSSSCVKGIKCALALMGICRDQLAEPLSSFESAEREQVRAALEKIDAVCLS